MSIYVYTNRDNAGEEHYCTEGDILDFDTDKCTCKKYASLSLALKDSEVIRNRYDYSRDDCIDYILNAIEQLEGTK